MIDTHRCTFAIAMATVLIALPVRSLHGQQASRRVTLEQALALFARNNVDLRVARADAAEAASLARQAAAYPNPELAATHEPLSGDGRTYSESYLNLSQRVQWPGTRSARQSAAERLATAAIATRLLVSAELPAVRLRVGMREVFGEFQHRITSSSRAQPS